METPMEKGYNATPEDVMVPERDSAQHLYLDLLKRALTRTIVEEKYVSMDGSGRGPTKKLFRLLFPPIRRMLKKRGLEIGRPYKADWAKREQGDDWPPEAETM